MTSRYLLDTNICIHIRQRRPIHVLERFRSLEPAAAAISVITYGELRFGIEKSHDRERAMSLLDELVRFLPVQPMPREAGATYGEMRAELTRRGELIGNNDLWIAAHARSTGLTLVTNNEREFRRVPGLVIENWAAA